MYRSTAAEVKLPMLTLQITDIVQYYCTNKVGCKVVFCELFIRTQREIGQGAKEAKGRGEKHANTLYYAYKVSDMKYWFTQIDFGWTQF